MIEDIKKISVIVPCYNDGMYLEETILSVLNSNYSNIEVIIVNDGSVDNTKEVGIALQNKYPNIIYLEQNNRGVSVARNNGIKHSSGEYILPLDADDLISPDYIVKAKDILDKNENVKVVYAEAEFIGNKNGKWDLPVFDRNDLAKENMIFSSAMYRKSDYNKTGGYAEEMLGGWEDWEFWISMLKDGGDVYKIPKVCFYYRIKPSSTSRRKSTTRKIKKETIDFINSKHSEFMFRELGGPLRYSRSWSKIINRARRAINVI